MDMTSENAELSAIVERYRDAEGGLLPALRDIQNTFGHISDAAKRQCAEVFNLSRAEVHGVASFYHDFRDQPAGKPVIRLCRAEACQARGGESLAAEAEAIASGRVMIEPVYCLGLCSVGPNAMVGEEVHARLGKSDIARLIDEAAA